jgi:alkylation response protein AidB-like acyl-CoA dehydrogenase
MSTTPTATLLREPIDADAVLENVESILPILDEEAQECSRIGHLTDRASAALRDAGVYRAGFARHRGGPELSLVAQTSMVEMVARIDGGIAWNAAILAATGFYAGRLGDAAFAELYPDMDLATAGSFHPRGRADRVTGGYRVTGEWSFGSGIHSATYVLGGCTVYDGAEPVLKDDGSPLVIGVWLPTAEVEILDDWHVIGLDASGSSGYRVADRFVPAEHSFDRYFEPDPNAEPLNKLVDLPFYSMAGIAIGLSQHAIDLATAALAGRPSVGERQLALLGEAESLLRSARAGVYEGVRRIDAAIFTDGALPSPNTMARGDAAVATDLARRIVDLCAELVGSRLIYEAFPMQRIIRDLVGLTAHASTWRSRWIDVGRTMIEEARA